MKRTLAKIFAVIPFVVYGILGLSFLLFQLEFREDFWTVVFLFTLAFGWILVLASAIASIALRFKDEKKSEFFFCSSIINCAIPVLWGGFVLRLFFAFYEPRPSPVYNLSWHLLDDSLQGEKIVLNLTAEDVSEKEPKTIVKQRKLEAGKTKKIRLPDKYFKEVEGYSKSDENVRVFVPHGFFINWREDLDKYTKQDAYEIIVYRQPQIDEDDEKFTMRNPPRDARFCLTRVLRTYTQNGREITTLNLELDGTNWVRTRFVSKDEKPIANAKAVVYVLFEGGRTGEDGEPLDTEIYAETDADGWLEVQGIPDGAECYIDFSD